MFLYSVKYMEGSYAVVGNFFVYGVGLLLHFGAVFLGKPLSFKHVGDFYAYILDNRGLFFGLVGRVSA